MPLSSVITHVSRTILLNFPLQSKYDIWSRGHTPASSCLRNTGSNLFHVWPKTGIYPQYCRNIISYATPDLLCPSLCFALIAHFMHCLMIEQKSVNKDALFTMRGWNGTSYIGSIHNKGLPRRRGVPVCRTSVPYRCTVPVYRVWHPVPTSFFVFITYSW